MSRFTIFSIFFIMFTILACGAPVYVAPTPTYQQKANTAAPNWTSTPEMPITAVVLSPLTVRKAPCESSSEVAYLEVGAVVEIIDEPITCREDGGRWVEIVKPHGFVNMRYLEGR